MEKINKKVSQSNATMTRDVKSDLSYFPVTRIQVARENDLLYEPFGMANGDDAALVVSVKEFGVQEPLTLSTDGVLLSGHRRFAAAKYLRLETVPVRFKDVIFAGLSKPERLKELRSFNSAPGELLQKKLRDAIESVIDVAEFKAQIDFEKEDAGVVEAYRRTVFQAIGGSLHG